MISKSKKHDINISFHASFFRGFHATHFITTIIFLKKIKLLASSTQTNVGMRKWGFCFSRME